MVQILVVLTLGLSLAACEPGLLAAPVDVSLPAGRLARALLTLASAAAMILICLAFNLRTARRLDRPDVPFNRRRFRLRQMLLIWAMALLFAGQVFYLRWGQVLLGDPPSLLAELPIARELAVWSPFALMLLGFWSAAYRVDLRLRALELQRRLAAGLPVYAPPGARGAYWTLGQFLAFQVRFQVLLVLLPLMAILLARAGLDWGFGRLDPVLAGRQWSAEQRQGLLLGAWVAVVIGVFLSAPAFLAYVLWTVPLPAGSLRDQLERVLRRGRVRVRKILLWRTHGMVSNAAVIGIWGRIRYVLLSDALLETLPDKQIEGVFGHELGHVIHHHVVYYLLLIGSLALLVDGAAAWAAASPWLAPLAETAAKNLARTIPGLAPPTLILAVQVFLGVLLGGGALFLFGWISRQFEWQADLTGAQAIMLGNVAGARLLPTGGVAAGDWPLASLSPARTPDADRSEAPADVANLRRPPHPAAAEIFVGSLFRIAEINGLDPAQRTWRHGSILTRGLHVRRLADPAYFRRFTRTIWLIKLGILVLTALSATMLLLSP